MPDHRGELLQRAVAVRAPSLPKPSAVLSLYFQVSVGIVPVSYRSLQLVLHLNAAAAFPIQPPPEQRTALVLVLEAQASAEAPDLPVPPGVHLGPDILHAGPRHAADKPVPLHCGGFLKEVHEGLGLLVQILSEAEIAVRGEGFGQRRFVDRLPYLSPSWVCEANYHRQYTQVQKRCTSIFGVVADQAAGGCLVNNTQRHLQLFRLIRVEVHLGVRAGLLHGRPAHVASGHGIIAVVDLDGDLGAKLGCPVRCGLLLLLVEGRALHPGCHLLRASGSSSGSCSSQCPGS